MHRSLTLAPIALTVMIALAACDSGQNPDAVGPGGPTSGEPDTAAGHGAVEGAQEVAEPQLHVVSVDADGAVGMLNLLTGAESEPGAIAPPTSVASDGRYLFANTDAGVEVVDSGVWTWDHVDHFHYYRDSPRLLGAVSGDGAGVVSTSGNATTGGTGILFSDSGRAVLLSNASLARGELDEMFRIPVEPHDGMVAPFGDGALVTAPDESGEAAELRFHGAAGAPVEGTTTPCPAAQGAITTRIGVVIGCADGAVLATVDDEGPTLEHIPYPEEVDAPAATDFRNRKGRPTVAAPAGDAGFWLLDTREREWRFVATEQPLVQVSASDDADEHVVALDRRGRIRVYDGADGTEIAVSEPLLASIDAAGPVAGSRDFAGVDLTVDRERAYVNDPASGLVHEIDYRGGARVARSLEPPTGPDFVAVTGR